MKNKHFSASLSLSARNRVPVRRDPDLLFILRMVMNWKLKSGVLNDTTKHRGGATFWNIAKYSWSFTQITGLLFMKSVNWVCEKTLQPSLSPLFENPRLCYGRALKKWSFSHTRGLVEISSAALVRKMTCDGNSQNVSFEFKTVFVAKRYPE